MNTSSASLSASESTGFFGAYGGQFVPDDLKARLDEVTEAFDLSLIHISRWCLSRIKENSHG